MTRAEARRRLEQAMDCQRTIHGMFDRSGHVRELSTSELSLVVSIQLNLDGMLIDILSHLLDQST